MGQSGYPKYLQIWGIHNYGSRIHNRRVKIGKLYVQRVQDPSIFKQLIWNHKILFLTNLDFLNIKWQIQSHHRRIHINGSKSPKFTRSRKIMLWLVKSAHKDSNLCSPIFIGPFSASIRCFVLNSWGPYTTYFELPAFALSCLESNISPLSRAPSMGLLDVN